MPCRRSVFCLLPPYMLEHIAKHGTPEERTWAVDVLSADRSLRAARVENTEPDPASPARSRVNVLAKRPEGEASITIYDAEREQRVSGPVLRSKDSPEAEDVAANEAYDAMEATFDFYWSAYQRNSIDDAGTPLNGAVHYGRSYPNALWDGREMLFGDGDGHIFNRFTVSLDVIAHELTHGVTGATAKLRYWDESGALNESVSDVLGSLVKQYRLRQTVEEADWLIGAGVLEAEGQALRSLKAPGTAYDTPELGKDPQPAHMEDYVFTLADYNGVHINSGIPNKAFYNVASALGGHAWERAGRIWYSTLLDPRLYPTARFLVFAKATARAARRLFPQEPEVEEAVRSGWHDVGIRL